jgi:hypothetical protein
MVKSASWKRKPTVPNWLILASLGLLAVLVLLPIAPHLQLTPQSDSSVFLYSGQRILDGAVPYRDVWDHKGPIIFYIDALGLALGGGSRWGVWLLEVAFAWLASVVGFNFLDRTFGRWPAILGSILLLLFLSPLLDGGNLVEEYVLPLQFLMLYLFTKSEPAQSKNYVLLGATAAAAFLLRPNLIGLPLAFGLLCFWQVVIEKKRVAFSGLGYAFTGGAGVLLLVTAYFWLNQALFQFWDAAFAFNFLYSQANLVERLESIRAGFSLTGSLGALALTGWLLAVLVLRNARKSLANYADIVLLLVLAFLLEVVFAALPGRIYTHYYMTWLPVFVSLSAFLLAYIGKLIKRAPKGLFRLLSISLLVGFSMTPVWRLLPIISETATQVIRHKGLPPISFSGHRLEPTLRYLNENTTADQEVLVWGNSVVINWLSNRTAPTRFVYQTPLFEGEYARPELVSELIDDLRAHPDALIIDTTSGGRSLTADPMTVSPILRPFYEFIRENYVPADKMGRTGWQVYVPAGTIH